MLLDDCRAGTDPLQTAPCPPLPAQHCDPLSGPRLVQLLCLQPGNILGRWDTCCVVNLSISAADDLSAKLYNHGEGPY